MIWLLFAYKVVMAYLKKSAKFGLQIWIVDMLYQLPCHGMVNYAFLSQFMYFRGNGYFI